LAEPIGDICGEARPPGQDQGDPASVIVSSRAVDDTANLKVARVGTSLINGCACLGDPFNWLSAIVDPHVEQLVRAAADVAELQLPLAEDHRLPTEVVL